MRIFVISLSVLFLLNNCEGQESSFQWTPQLEDALQKMYHHANLSGDNPEQRMKDEWDRQFPMYSHLDSDYLWQHAQASIGITGIENKRKLRMEPGFTKEHDGEFMKIYLENRGSSKKIQQAWEAEYPEFKNMPLKQLTQGASDNLLRHGYKHDEMKSFKWEARLKSELVMIYHLTDSGESNHSGRIYDEWIKRHEKLSYMKPGYLMDKARSFIDESRKRRMKKSRVLPGLTEKHDEKLVKIYLENEGSPRKIRQAWETEYPELKNITNKRLMQRAHHQLRRGTRTYTSGNRHDGMKFFKWGARLRSELILIYHLTDSGESNHSGRIYDEWIKRHEMLSYMEPGYLMDKARSFIDESRMEKKKDPIVKPVLTNEQKEKLVKIYLENRGSSKKIHQAWEAEYPEFRMMTEKQLIQRAYYLLRCGDRNDGMKFFKWGARFRSELVMIYHLTDSGESNHSGRIYDEWIKRHETLSYMEPHYLLNKARYFIDESRIKKKKEPIMEPALTNEQEEKLVKIYLENEGNPNKIHQAWGAEYPEFMNMTLKQLVRRASYLVEHGNMKNAIRAVDSLPKVRPHRETYNFHDRDMQEPLVNPEQYMIHRVHLNTPRLSMEHFKRSHNDYYSTADRANWGADLTLGRDSWTHHYGVDQEYGEGTSSQHNTFKPNYNSESYNISTSYRRHE